MTDRTAFHLKLAVLVVCVVAFVLVPYFIWHEPMDAYFASQAYQDWLKSVRPYAWAIAIGLLVGDLVLPIPTTPIMATLGVLYGALLGGLIGSAGSVLAGLVAYGLARLLGERASRLLASEEEMADLRVFFDTWGVGGIIASRALPVVPEVLTFMAGLARMRLGRFVPALLIGALPVGLLLAWAGQASGTSSRLLLVLTLTPAALWFAYLLGARRARMRRAPVPQPAREPADPLDVE
ncbi:MAG: TVP38/TMEM64 family protein [Planctomycetota bacterium]